MEQPTLFELPDPVDVPGAFPLGDYENALGPRACEELKKAKPEEWCDPGFIADRFVLNPGALAYWLYIHFKLNILNLTINEEEALQVDTMSERVSIGDDEYSIPHWCFIPTIMPEHDPRPKRWPGIPQR